MSWIQTYTGKQFYPLDPKPDDICIEDIAHALSMICRFNGHCNRFYSVAEHSVLVSLNLKSEYALTGLLHDAQEAYISDLTSPVKKQISQYSKIEAGLEKAIFSAFGVSWDSKKHKETVKSIDCRILMDERSQLFDIVLPWSTDCESLGIKLNLWNPETAEWQFLKLFKELTND